MLRRFALVLVTTACEPAPSVIADAPPRVSLCSGRWMLEPQPGPDGCSIDPFGLTFELQPGPKLQRSRGYPLWATSVEDLDGTCKVTLTGVDRFHADGELRLELSATASGIAGTASRIGNRCRPLTVTGVRDTGTIADVTLAEQRIELRRALAQIIEHCGLSPSLGADRPTRFELEISALGSLTRATTNHGPLDLDRTCADWRVFTEPSFLPNAAATPRKDVIVLDPREIHELGIGPLTLGLAEQALPRLGMTTPDLERHVSFTQDGEARPVTARFDTDWYWPDLDRPQIVAHTGGPFGEVVTVTVHPPLVPATVVIPPSQPSPLMLSQAADDVIASLDRALASSADAWIRGRDFVDLDNGTRLGSYDLLSLCHMKWRFDDDGGAFTLSPFIAVDGSVFWSEGGRVLPDGRLLVCTSSTEVIAIEPDGRAAAWVFRHDVWQPQRARCEARVDEHFGIRCETTYGFLPSSFIKVGREVLPWDPVPGIRTSSAPREQLVGAPPERLACESLVDGYWREVEPTLDVFAIADHRADERAFRWASETREFVDACTRAPATVRQCFIDGATLHEARACIAAHPDGWVDDDEPPRLPALDRKELASTPAPDLSPEEQRREAARLVGTWKGVHDTWEFDADGRARASRFGEWSYAVPRHGVLQLSRPDRGWTLHYAIAGDRLYVHNHLVWPLGDRERFLVSARGDQILFDHGRCTTIDDLGVATAIPCDRTEDRLTVRTGKQREQFQLFDHVIVDASLEPCVREP